MEIYDDDQFENLDDLIADEINLLKMAGCKHIQPFSFEKWFPHCQEKVSFGQVSFVSSSTKNAAIKRQGFRIFTSLNEFLYILQVECPIDDFKTNEQTITEILNSFEIDCRGAVVSPHSRF